MTRDRSCAIVPHMDSSDLRTALIDAQYTFLELAKSSLVVIACGVPGAGKSDSINKLMSWLDPHYVCTSAFGKPKEHEKAHPVMWRYWAALPPKGSSALCFGCWYGEVLAYEGKPYGSPKKLISRLAHIASLEKMLSLEDIVLVKLWFDLDAKTQKERFNHWGKNKSERWKLGVYDWTYAKHYEKHMRIANKVMNATDVPHAPWLRIDSREDETRNFMVGQAVLKTLQRSILEQKAKIAAASSKNKIAPSTLSMLGTYVIQTKRFGQKTSAHSRFDLDASPAVRNESQEELKSKTEKKLSELSEKLRRPSFQKKALMVVFEGADAAGKGGAIRHLCRAIDIRMLRVIPISAPSSEEKKRPYLWRFWRQVPQRGQITFFDRSWYGRVLVERVEKLASESEWMRAYDELNHFEAELHEANIMVCKYYLHVSSEEQLNRFRERENTPYKHFKLTEEDWRNRKKSPLYREAARDMFANTNTPFAPWYVIPADDKKYARYEITKILVSHLDKC